MLEETVRWGPVLRFQNVQVIQDLLLVKVQRTAFEVNRNVRQTSGVVGKGTLAFAGQFYRPF